MGTLDQWTDYAACAGLDTDDFFATKADRVAEAIKICETCAFKTACLERQLAWERDEPASTRFGIFGGTTPKQRAAIYAERAGIDDGPDAATYAERAGFDDERGCGEKEGTPAGHQRHRRRKEKPCRACADAERIRWIESRERRKIQREHARSVA